MIVLMWGVILPKKRDKLNLWGLFTSILNIKKGVQILSSRRKKGAFNKRSFFIYTNKLRRYIKSFMRI